LTIRSIDPDPRASAITTAAGHLGLDAVDPSTLQVADIVFVEGDLTGDALTKLHGFLVDPLLQKGSWANPTTTGTEITFLPGVTDTAAASLMHAADQLGVDISVAATGRRVEFGDGVPADDAERAIRRVVANPVIERWTVGCIEPTFHAESVATGHADTVPISAQALRA
jgi:phosphoribosylformylglycinamidine synthase